MNTSATFTDRVDDAYDYIVVGSGAGGGPVAANLARAGRRVLVLEAGGHEEPPEYQVPAFHALSTEHDDLAWRFFVKHYDDDSKQNDPKFVKAFRKVECNGVFYPRAGTLGGCTAHHALIFIYPHNSDWDAIAELTGDASWAADDMRRIFQRMEHCDYAGRWLGLFNPARHGYDGWLHTNVADPKLLLRDKKLARLVAAAFKESHRDYVQDPIGFVDRVWARLQSRFDPNDWRRVRESFEGVTFTPLTVRNGRRIGSRERIVETMLLHPHNLHVKLNALVTRVVLDQERRATGVEFVDAPHLYRADWKADRTRAADPPVRRVSAKREVIVAGGSFNTPQLLMLSGIGPADHLKERGIDVVVDLPGVGQNLQDRYEVGVVHKMDEPFDILRDASFTAPGPAGEPDPEFADWLGGKGLYATNGAVIALITRSHESRPEPDLYMFAVPGFFAGYAPGYSERTKSDKNYFTWVILKAHTNNTAGYVRLRSRNPWDTPDINFRYFDDGNDSAKEDLDSVVAGIRQVREITARTPRLMTEELPGAQANTDDELRDFVKCHAWGHHACGTCRIGKDGDRGAVLDSRFRVRNTKNLRVVDASVFPRIPGFFILSAVYMIAEKASDVILEGAS